MDRRGARGRARRGTGRGDDTANAGHEEIPAGRGRGQGQGAGLEERVVNAIERGFLAMGRGRGRHAAQMDDEEDRFRFIYDSFRKTTPPSFQGDSLAAAEEWLANIKSKFRVCRAPMEFRVELATHYLENDARFWWENKKLDFDGDQDAIPWEWFEENFNEQYADDIRKEEMRQRFVELKQGNKTVAEYNTEFTNLSRYATDIRGDPKRYRRHYISGLRPKIAGAIDDPYVTDLKRSMNHAAQKEVHHKRELEEEQARKVKTKVGDGQSSVNEKGKGKSQVDKEDSNERVWCRTCNKPHVEKDCHHRLQTCFNCGSSDHWKRECPHPPKYRPFVYQGNGGHPRGGGQGAGRNGGRIGGRGGGRTGVFAVELVHESPFNVSGTCSVQRTERDFKEGGM
ncbi:hypothetical protein LUZ63_003024 [Rhynchospora breviuscula]|uniref:CCHC-type domain-containing protein n=1 Tax=Rhynchospora breviuscula TaxID=2022672 RepID=A0A9Q0HZ17_9POAL|nr:hypothetical protein LUZ63_003024 [Rhynchospora breviuscula]